jgi:DNA polymerase III subunit beta
MTMTDETYQRRRPYLVLWGNPRCGRTTVKLRAERAEFADAIAWATRTVGARVTLPALSGVLLDAADGRLTCRATDLEIAAEISIPVQIDEPGKVLLPGQAAGPAGREVPGGSGRAVR